MTVSDFILHINDLHVSCKTNKDLKPILCGVNFSIKRGEAIALVGESGSGKSLTALAILQLLSSSMLVTGGEISFNSESLLGKSQRELRMIRGKKIGMIFQDPMTSLNPTLSVGWQIAEVLITHEKLTKHAAQLKAIELLKRVGIADAPERYHTYPFQMSGGMRQRVMIAIALACQPDLLIADEPTTALDVTIQAQILDLLRTIRQETGMSLLLITHDLGVVASLCDRAAVMNGGKIVECNSVETLLSDPQHPYTYALIDAQRGSHR